MSESIAILRSIAEATAVMPPFERLLVSAIFIKLYHSSAPDLNNCAFVPPQRFLDVADAKKTVFWFKNTSKNEILLKV